MSKMVESLSNIYTEILNHREFKRRSLDKTENNPSDKLRDTEKVLAGYNYALPTERLTIGIVNSRINTGYKAPKKEIRKPKKTEKTPVPSKTEKIIETLTDGLDVYKKGSYFDRADNLNSLCEIYNDVINSEYPRIKKDNENIETINTLLKESVELLKENNFMIDNKPFLNKKRKPV